MRSDGSQGSNVLHDMLGGLSLDNIGKKTSAFEDF